MIYKRIFAFVVAVVIFGSLCIGRDVYADSDKGKVKAYISGELVSGTIIEEENAYTELPSSGMARLMTALLCMESVSKGKLKLTDKVKISKEASKQSGTRVFLDSGTEYPAEKLIYALAMASANDAAYALAEHIAGTEEGFVSLMNEKAKQLGCDCTFYDSTGLDKRTEMSACDIFKICREIAKYPLFFQYSSVYQDSFTHDSGRMTDMVNNNRLVRVSGINGMATASSKEAGYCISATMSDSSAIYCVVVLGADNSDTRFREALTMLTNAKANYSLKTFAKKGARAGTVKIEKSVNEYYSFYTEEDMDILIVKGTESEITKEIELDELIAPMYAGDIIGRLKIKLPDGLEYETSLILCEDAERVSVASSICRIICGFIGKKNARADT